MKTFFYLVIWWLMPLVLMLLLFSLLEGLDLDTRQLLVYLMYYTLAYLVYLYVVLIIFIKKFGHNWTMPFILSAIIYFINSSVNTIIEQLPGHWLGLHFIPILVVMFLLWGINIVWALSFFIIKILRKIK